MAREAERLHLASIYLKSHAELLILLSYLADSRLLLFSSDSLSPHRLSLSVQDLADLRTVTPDATSTLFHMMSLEYNRQKSSSFAILIKAVQALELSSQQDKKELLAFLTKHEQALFPTLLARVKRDRELDSALLTTSSTVSQSPSTALLTTDDVQRIYECASAGLPLYPPLPYLLIVFAFSLLTKR